VSIRNELVLISEFGTGYSSARSSTENAQGHSSAACWNGAHGAACAGNA